jgi:hypothetical protein
MKLIQGQIPGLEQNREHFTKAAPQAIVLMFFGTAENNRENHCFIILTQ